MRRGQSTVSRATEPLRTKVNGSQGRYRATPPKQEKPMTKLALYVPLQAKPGKEKEVADFLRSALPLVTAEPGTISWFAHPRGAVRIRDRRHIRRRGQARCASQRESGGGLGGKGQGGRSVCQ